MNRNIICLLILQIALAGSINRTIKLLQERWTDSDLFSEEEEVVDDIFSKVLSNEGKRESIVKPFSLEELYFHNEEQEFSMRLYKLESYSKFDFNIENLHTVLPERHIEMDLILPKLFVEGFYEADRMAYDDFDSKASGHFWLTLSNVTASGVGLLKIENNTTLEIDKMRLTFNVKSRSLQLSQHVRNPRLAVFIDSEMFGRTIVRKCWRDLSYNLNKAVQERMNPVLKKRPLNTIIKNEEKFAKFTDFVVSSTETANQMVDIIVEYGKNVITEKYNGKIKIPNVNEGFEKQVLFVTWKGGFYADSGTARGLATVERVGDTVFASGNDSNMHFYGTLGFEHIDLFYDYYKAHFMGLGPTGSFSTKFFPIDIYGHIRVDYSERRVFLEAFQVMKVGEMEVNMSGWGWLLDFLATKIATWVGGLFKDKIVYDLQNKYDHYIQEILSNYDLDDILEGRFK